jgi:hypothetical protein
MWLPHDTPMGSQLESRRFYNEPLNDPETDARHAALFEHEEAQARELRDFLLRWREKLRSAAQSPPEGA